VISERVGAIGRSTILDRVVEPLAAIAGPALSATPVKNALSGTWLGHRVHPMLTDVTLGTLLSATALDVLTFDGESIAEITAFISPDCFARFGLPDELACAVPQRP